MQLECIELRDAIDAICYPRPDDKLCKHVLEELREVGVECYVPLGKRIKAIDKPLLGSGWAGNVFAARWNGALVAVKVVKPGSRRTSILREALLATVASAYGIAPRIHAVERHVMVMDLIRGPRLSEYKPPSLWHAYHVLRRLLYKAYILDKLGIDHGELARPGGQVLIDEENHEPYIVDFDSASAARKTRNVTALASGLQKIPWARQIVRPSSDPETRKVLRSYRENKTLENFEKVLEALGLT